LAYADALPSGFICDLVNATSSRHAGASADLAKGDDIEDPDGQAKDAGQAS
jgi:hypothetical protein